MNKQFSKSVVSGTDLVPIFSLGELYVSDFLKSDENPKHEKCKLELGFDPVSKVIQLTEQPPASAMFGSFYWYLSATNPAMRAALKELAESTINCIPESNSRPVFLDIASNDNTLLSFVPKHFERIGIDPSKYTLIEDAADITIQDYFSKEAFKKSGHNKARYITCAAMFYDLDNPVEFLNDVYDILEDSGVFVLQLSYTPLMIKQMEFSNICHEHLCYYNLTSLKYLFDKTGFKIQNVELNNTNGGSIRVYLQKKTDISGLIKHGGNFLSPADRDICDIRIQSLLNWEEVAGFNDIKIYQEFYDKIRNLQTKTLSFISSQKNKGKSIWAYGASTKGNTLLQTFGLDNNLIDGIAEKQERKWGLKTIGSNIPIFSEEDFRKAAPDYCLILPWAFGEEFKRRESEYLKNGCFIFPAPDFYLYSKGFSLYGK